MRKVNYLGVLYPLAVPIKIILLTLSPDQRVNILEVNHVLEQHNNQIQQLAKENRIGPVDSFTIFKERVLAGDSIPMFMSQVNHPNAEGHTLIANEIIIYFQ